MAHRNRKDGKRTEHLLKKGQLHFERVLRLVRIVENMDEGKREDLPARGFVDVDRAQWRREGRAAWHREPCEPNVMTGPDQHDARNQLTRSFDAHEGGRGNLTRIHVACMGHDQSLGPRIGRRRRFARRIEVSANRRA